MARKHSKASRKRAQTFKFTWSREPVKPKGKHMVEWVKVDPLKTWDDPKYVERDLSKAIYEILFKSRNPVNPNVYTKWARQSGNAANTLFAMLRAELGTYEQFWRQGRYRRTIRRNVWFIVENFEAINAKMVDYKLPEQFDYEYFVRLQQDMEFLEDFGFVFSKTIRRKLMQWRLSEEKSIG